ncbi:MAG: hypothetical protein ABFD54_14035 [Armatimonadota bacterium]|nr:hypothetical protein [bacterium]
MKTIWVVAFLFTCNALVVADDGGVHGVGGSAELIKPEHSSIRMIREQVNAQVLRSWRTPPRVRCEFVFKNEGKATTVKMGFPEMSAGELAPIPDKNVTALDGYLSWVDGKPVKTRIVPSRNNGDQNYQAWHIKDVSFAAGQTRTIVDSYSGGMGGDVDGNRWFNYILKTGASWKGPIGKAAIKVNIKDMLHTYKIDRIEPQGYKKNDGIVSWTLTNIEPKQNISIAFSPLVIIMINDTPMGPLLYERINNTSMALASELSNALAADFAINRGVYIISKAHHKLKMTAESKTATLDSKRLTLPVAPYVGRNNENKPDLVVPVATVIKALGGMVKLSKDGQFLNIKI